MYESQSEVFRQPHELTPGWVSQLAPAETSYPPVVDAGTFGDLPHVSSADRLSHLLGDVVHTPYIAIDRRQPQATNGMKTAVRFLSPGLPFVVWGIFSPTHSHIWLDRHSHLLQYCSPWHAQWRRR